jgi:hypothetical protein
MRTLFFGAFAYTREGTRLNEKGKYIAVPTDKYLYYARLIAVYLIGAVRSGKYDRVICICPGTIITPERQETDGRVLGDMIWKEVMRYGSYLVRQIEVINTHDDPSCESRGDAQRFHELALKCSLEVEGGCTDLSNPYQFTIAFSCDRGRTKRTLQAVRNHFGRLRFDKRDIVNTVRFEGFIGALKQTVFRWIDVAGYALPFVYRGQYRRRMRQLEADNLIYRPGYSPLFAPLD